MSRIFTFLFLILPYWLSGQTSVLSGKIICIDPGHGGTAATDQYRVGPSGEREEWVNLRVALKLHQMLEAKGAKVIMTRTDDIFIPLENRSQIAKENKADVFVSVHHNATADSAVNFPIIYFHGNASENTASVSLGRYLAKTLREYLFTSETPVSLVSDFTVFAGAGASVLRNTYGIPAILAEASFFTNPSEEHRLKQDSHNEKEALAYLKALELFFAVPSAVIQAKNSIVPVIPVFKVFQEAERMKPEARLWKEYYEKGSGLMKKKDVSSREQAYDLFTQSARFFPDSYVAGECHRHRAVLLKQSGLTAESADEKRRYKEYYVEVR